MGTDDDSFFYLYGISYLWYGPLGFLVCAIVGVVVSLTSRLVLKDEPSELDTNLFVPFLASRIARRRENKAARISVETAQYNIGKYEAGQAKVYAG